MLILTSSVQSSAHSIVTHFPKKPQEYRTTFIPTAAEVEEGDLSWLDKDRQALVDVGFELTDFTLTGKTSAQVKEMLDSTDFLFVSGGNTFFLLQEMRKSGFDSLIHEYVKNGLIYGGASAGSVVAGPDVGLTKELDDPTQAPELTDYEGLGLIDVVIFPHWGSKTFHDRFEKLMKAAYGKGRKIILLTDEQYLVTTSDGYRVMGT
jgi:dipeptidase E